jgi:hypothetical protein
LPASRTGRWGSPLTSPGQINIDRREYVCTMYCMYSIPYANPVLNHVKQHQNASVPCGLAGTVSRIRLPPPPCPWNEAVLLHYVLPHTYIALFTPLSSFFYLPARYLATWYSAHNHGHPSSSFNLASCLNPQWEISRCDAGMRGVLSSGFKVSSLSLHAISYVNSR